MKNEQDIKQLAQQQWGNVHRTGVLGFIDGYVNAQADVNKLLETLQNSILLLKQTTEYDVLESFQKQVKEFENILTKFDDERNDN